MAAEGTLTRDQARAIDRRAIEEYGLPGPVLMENAGRGSAELLIGLGVSGGVVVCAGTGNNGGDGFVIARHLDNRGVDVRVLLFGDPARLTPDAAGNFRCLQAARLAVDVRRHVDPDALRDELSRADWVVDALLGTGAAGAPRPPLDAVIAAMNRSGAKLFAVDLPSGLDADTGDAPAAAIRAHRTATFVARKRGFDAPAAADYLGVVHVVDIGVPRRLVADVTESRPAFSKD